jgi:hypothetical protein
MSVISPEIEIKVQKLTESFRGAETCAEGARIFQEIVSTVPSMSFRELSKSEQFQAAVNLTVQQGGDLTPMQDAAIMVARHACMPQC